MALTVIEVAETATNYAAALGVPVVPCGCSQRTGTVRRSLRDLFAGLEVDYPHIKENILSAMGNVDPSRLLDPRLFDPDLPSPVAEEFFPIVTES